MSGEGDAMARAGEAGAIVRALAACDAPVFTAYGPYECVLCGDYADLAPPEHEPECPWLRAKRYAEGGR